MRRFDRKKGAFLLALILLLETACPIQLTAAVVSDAPSVVAETTKEAEDGEILDLSVSGNSSKADTSAVSANTTEVKEAVSENSVVLETGEDEISEENKVLFQYLYLQSDYIKAPGNQYFLMGIGDETTSVTEAELTLTNLYTGAETVVAAEDIFEGMALFCVPFNDAEERSIYQVTGAGFTAEGECQQLSLPEIGVEAYFGVNEMITYADEDIAVDLAQVEAQVVTVDGMEITTTADSIDSALETARQEALKEQVFQSEGILSGKADTEKFIGNKSQDGNVVIVLDPGHDATHCGASGNNLKEEVLTLKIAHYCREALEEYDGVTVYMTRTTEACPFPGTTSTVDNYNRVQYAKSVGADAYVSIHLNSSTSSSPNGAVVFYPNSSYNSSIGATGQALAAKIQAKLVELGLTNRGIAIRNSEDNSRYPDGSLADYYGVIKNSKLAGFPGIIVEHAFLSSASDAANYLSSEEKLKKLGVADAEGIAEFFGLEKSEGEGKLMISNVNYKEGSFRVNLKKMEEGLKIRFKVYPKSDPNQVIWYNAFYQSNTYYAKVQVKYHNYQSGEYVIIAYKEEPNGTRKRLTKREYEFSEPTYEGATIKAEPASKIEKKFKFSTSAMSGVQGITFEVWNNERGKSTKQTFKATENNQKVWSTTVGISKLKYAGKYTLVAYADTCFKTRKQIGKITFTVSEPTVGKVKISSQNTKKGTFELSIPNVSCKSGIKKVEIRVWSAQDKKAVKTYTAKKKADGSYAVTGNIKYHDYNYGNYKAEATVTANNGLQTVSKKYTIKVKQPVAVITAKTSATQKKTDLQATNVAVSGKAAAVKFVVCSQEGKKKDKVTYQAKKTSSGKWKATVKNADIGKSGKYYVTAYAKSQTGSYKKVGTTTYEVKGPKIGEVIVRNKKTAKGTFDVAVSGVSATGGIQSVEVTVYRIAAQKVTYKAKKSGKKYVAKAKISDCGGKSGTYKVVVTATSKAGIKTTYKKINVSMGKSVTDNNGYTIMGDTTVTVNQMMAYYKANASYPSYYAGSDAPTLKKFCELYLDECETEGVRAEVAFIQAMKETNFLRYGGDVQISQYNFAGLGATGGGVRGESFASVQIGIRAQVQHLKAYASTEPLVNACVDGRFKYVTRGCAPYVEWLGINENPAGKGWATDKGYGTSILSMIATLKGYSE